VQSLYDGMGIFKKSLHIDAAEAREVYAQLHAYARSKENFDPSIRTAIDGLPTKFPELAKQIAWGQVDFIADKPGKNSGRAGLAGGGESSQSLAALLAEAKHEVLIQSPYLVLSDPALELFRQALARGVRVRIHTNSLASTDNLQAFAGYRNQREQLLALGLEVFEFKPDSLIQRQIMERYRESRLEAPIFALHAKTMVVDRSKVFIGTYNLDPRSENLNTEVGVLLNNASQASEVATAIEADMRATNSWDARKDDPDRFASWWKRARVTFWQWMPMKALL